MADAEDSKSSEGNLMRVRLPPPAPAFARSVAKCEGCPAVDVLLNAEADQQLYRYETTAWHANLRLSLCLHSGQCV